MKLKSLTCYGLFLAVSFTVEAQELLAPTNMTLVGVSPLALRVQFTDTNTAENAYVIYHSHLSPNGPFFEEWAIDGSTDVGQTHTWIFGGYEPLTTVYVKVVAVDIDENTGQIKAYGPSEVLSATTLEFYQAQPTDFRAESQGSHIRLTWTDTTPAGSEGDEFIFTLMRAEDGVNYTRSYTLPANTTSFKDTDVQPNKFYTYRLDAENEYGVNGEYLMNFASASLKKQQTLVYPNPTNMGTVTVNLDNQYNQGTVNVKILQPVIGIYYSSTVVLHGSKFTLDAFSSLPHGQAYYLVLTLPDGNVETTMVFNREN